MPKLMIHDVEACGTRDEAKNIKIDEISGMSADSVQEALVAINNSLTTMPIIDILSTDGTTPYPSVYLTKSAKSILSVEFELSGSGTNNWYNVDWQNPWYDRVIPQWPQALGYATRVRVSYIPKND